MAIRKNERVVAIVGRPNVGKSALFNRLAGRRISIVHDMPGVTRDRISAPLRGGTVPIELVDTGGIGAALEDGFADQVKLEASIAIESADVILFVVDVLDGRHPVDDAVAQMLRKQNKRVILGLNKADDPKHENLVGDFAKYGFKNTIAFSATHGRGIPQLIEMMEANVAPLAPGEAAVTTVQGRNRQGKTKGRGKGPEMDKNGDVMFDTVEEEEVQDRILDPLNEAMKLAIIGRPNVGKSSLFNAIIGENRSIVSSIAGTTRDAVDQYYERGGMKYVLIDTAGIRRRGKVDTPVESFSVQRAERSIRRADMVALVFDCSQGITAQERTIAGKILEENKPCLLVANKFDLYHPGVSQKDRLEELEEYARRELYFLDYAPLVAVSAKEGQHLNRVFGAIERVKVACDSSPSTGLLNRFLAEMFERNPPPLIGGKRLKLYYATLQREEHPRPVKAPQVILFVNYKRLVPPTYMRYLDNRIREEFGYEGLPVKFDVRERRRE